MIEASFAHPTGRVSKGVSRSVQIGEVSVPASRKCGRDQKYRRTLHTETPRLFGSTQETMSLGDQG